MTSINFLLSSQSQSEGNPSVSGKCQDGSNQEENLGVKIGSEEWIWRDTKVIAKT